MGLLQFHKIITRVVYFISALVLLQIFFKTFYDLVQSEGYYIKTIVYSIGFLFLMYTLSIFIAKLRIQERYFVFFIVFFAFLLRLVWIVSVKTAVFSDFKNFFNVAQNLFNGQPKVIYNDIYYYLFPHNVPYTVFLALVYKVFPSLFALKFVNVLFSTGIVYFIYRLIIKITDNKKTARIGALLTAIFPPFIIYTSVLTNQTISIFFLVWALYLFFSHKNLVLVGLVLGLANLFRPTIVMYLAGLLVYLVYYQLQKDKSLKEVFKNIFIGGIKIAGAFYLLIFIVGQSFVQAGISKTGLFHNPEPSYKLLVGLNPKTTGSYSTEDASLTGDIAHFEEKAKKLILERSKDKKKLIKLFNNKITSFWAKEDAALFWATYKLNDKMDPLGFTNSDVHYFYFSLLIFTLVFLLFSFKKDKKSMVPIYLLVVFLGFWLVYIFIEIQTRYRYEIYPIFIILASWGIWETYINRTKKNIL